MSRAHPTNTLRLDPRRLCMLNRLGSTALATWILAAQTRKHLLRKQNVSKLIEIFARVRGNGELKHRGKQRFFLHCFLVLRGP